MNESTIQDVQDIQGLTLLPNAIDAETASRIVTALEGELWKPWSYWRKFSRQDFGYEYDITSRLATPTTAIPDELRALFPMLRDAGWTGGDPTQVIVNRYPRGGTLNRHIDAPIFGPEVAALSLQTEWPIVFDRHRRNVTSIPQPVHSAYVMRGEARSGWFHTVPPNYDGQRISLTFRTMSAKGAQAGRSQPWRRYPR